MSRMNPSRSNLWRVSIWIFMAALLYRGAWVIATDQIHQFPLKEMVRTAQTFAERGELADPFVLPTGPTAHVPPLYPILLGLIFRVFGTGVITEIIKCLLTCVVGALRCALMPLLASRMGLSLRTGMIAGCIGAVYINALSTEVKGDWAEPYGALAVLAMVFAALEIAQRNELRLKRATGLGLWWGLLLLLMPNLLPVLLGFLIVGAMRFLRQEPRRYLGWSVVLLVVAALVVSPWPIRNQIRLGSPIWSKDNFGLVMQVSNHPGATWSTWDNDPYMQIGSPARDANQARRVKEMGEIAYNQAKLQEALAWIRAEPRQFAWLSVQRAFHFWFPIGHNLAHTALEWGLTLAAFFGLYLLYLRNRVAALLILSMWLLFPWPYFVTQWSSRFRQPIAWTLTLTAAVTIERAVRRQFPE